MIDRDILRRAGKAGGVWGREREDSVVIADVGVDDVAKLAGQLCAQVDGEGAYDGLSIQVR